MTPEFKVGDKVKGRHYGDAYTGTVVSVKPFCLGDSFTYRVKLDKPMDIFGTMVDGIFISLYRFKVNHNNTIQAA